MTENETTAMVSLVVKLVDLIASEAPGPLTPGMLVAAGGGYNVPALTIAEAEAVLRLHKEVTA